MKEVSASKDLANGQLRNFVYVRARAAIHHEAGLCNDQDTPFQKPEATERNRPQPDTEERPKVQNETKARHI